MVWGSGSTSNSFYNKVSDSGYYEYSLLDLLVMEKRIEGVIKVPLVHLCYMVRCDQIKKGLSYATDGVQMEFVCFARSARENGVAMYVSNELQGLMDPHLSPDEFEKSVIVCKSLRYYFNKEHMEVKYGEL